MPRMNGLDAIIPTKSRILILGSFPSPKSLEMREYYAKSSNRFWKLMGEVFEIKNLAESPYEYKLASLAKEGIALWDVIASCERDGASDSKIRAPLWNHIQEKIDRHNEVEKIILNGSTAARFFATAINTGPKWNPPQQVQCLSTSAANQFYGPWDVLLADWRPHLLP